MHKVKSLSVYHPQVRPAEHNCTPAVVQSFVDVVPFPYHCTAVKIDYWWCFKDRVKREYFLRNLGEE